MLRHWIPVALGGAGGAVLRYTVAGLVETSRWRTRLPVAAGSLPMGTLIVNLSGCLAIGVLAGALLERSLAPASLRAFLLIGVLGGYTTFSTFALETLRLLRDGSFVLAAVNAVGSPLLGLLGVWLGDSLSRLP